MLQPNTAPPSGAKKDETTAIKSQISKITNQDPAKVLRYLEEEGIISISDTESLMRRKEKEERLAGVHKYKVFKSNGRWHTTVKDDSKPDGRRRISKLNKDDLLDELVEFYEAYEVDDKSDWTLEDVYYDWLKLKKLKIKETCVLRIQRSWKSYYDGTEIVSIPVRDLNELQLDEWAHSLIKDNKLTKTEYYNMSIIMRQGLDHAVKLGIIMKNVFRDIEIDGDRVFKRVHKKPPETQVFTWDEVQEVFKLALEDYWGNKRLRYELAPLGAAFIFLTRMRLSEVTSAQYKHIEGDQLHVQAMFEYETAQEADTFKGTFDVDGERQIYLTEEANAIIDLCKKRQKEKGVSADGYIFSLTDGPTTGLYDAIKRDFYKYSVAVGGQKRSPNKGRKTGISIALNEGIALDTVARDAGHKDSRTTLNAYGYDTASEKARKKKYREVYDKSSIFRDASTCAHKAHKNQKKKNSSTAYSRAV